MCTYIGGYHSNGQWQLPRYCHQGRWSWWYCETRLLFGVVSMGNMGIVGQKNLLKGIVKLLKPQLTTNEYPKFILADSVFGLKLQFLSYDTINRFNSQPAMQCSLIKALAKNIKLYKHEYHRQNGGIINQFWLNFCIKIQQDIKTGRLCTAIHKWWLQ